MVDEIGRHCWDLLDQTALFSVFLANEVTIEICVHNWIFLCFCYATQRFTLLTEVLPTIDIQIWLYLNDTRPSDTLAPFIVYTGL